LIIKILHESCNIFRRKYLSFANNKKQPVQRPFIQNNLGELVPAKIIH